jgi:hypothetical protein
MFRNVCFRPIADISAGWKKNRLEAETMTLPSMRVPIATTLSATLMAWRAYETAPEYSRVQTERMGWTMLGSLLLAVGFLWELVRWYQRMDRRYLPER